MVRTRTRAPRGMTSQGYPASVEIIWRFDGSRQDGMPSPEVGALMAECEDVLDALEDSRHGFLGMSITGNGRREWVWYAADPAVFSTRAQELVAESGNRFPVEVRRSTGVQ